VFSRYAGLVDHLRARLPADRFEHSLAVAATALWLSSIHNVDRRQAFLAGLLHDYARHYPPERLLNLAHQFAILVSKVDVRYPVLLHGPVGARLVCDCLHIADPQIGRAIALHSTAGAGMDELSQVIYLADSIAPGRQFAAVERLRLLAAADLPYAVWQTLRAGIDSLVRNGRPLHPDTVAAYHEFQALFQ